MIRISLENSMLNLGATPSLGRRGAFVVSGAKQSRVAIEAILRTVFACHTLRNGPRRVPINDVVMNPSHANLRGSLADQGAVRQAD